MASQGPFFPATATTEAVAPENANNWTNSTNIGADDNAEAQITAATYDANDISFRLKGQNFGFTIPSGATIDGIVVEIAQRRFAGAAVDERVQLLDAAGALVGANKADPTAWPGVETIRTYGGATDTWTAVPTPAMVNDIDFGVAHSVKATAANTDIGVDFIRVTVYYTGPPPVELAGISAGVATVTAALTVTSATVDLAGVSAGVATVSGALALSLPLAAAPAGVATVAGAMAVARPLAAAPAGIATVSGAMAVTLALAAAPAGVATVSGAMAVALSLAAAPAGVATVTAALTVTAGTIDLAGAPAGIAIVSGAIALTLSLAAAPSGVATVSGDVKIALALAAQPAGVATVTAALTVLTTQWQDYGGIILLDVAKFGGTVSYFFEATLKVTGGTGRARLYDITGDVVVTGSQVSTDSATLVRQRSGALSLTESKEYKTQQGATTGATVTIRGARVLVEQS